MPNSYRTLACTSSGEITEKRSRFICSMSPASSREEAEAFVAKIRAENRDARHNVFAYILREGDFCRYSDDGEPQGTGGAPLTDILRGAELYDVCAVVTRYFGGVLLGTGGLARAYSEATKAALLAAEVIVKTLCAELSIECDYGFYGALPALAASFGGTVTQSSFAAGVTAVVTIPVDMAEPMSAALVEKSSGRVRLAKVRELYCNI